MDYQSEQTQSEIDDEFSTEVFNVTGEPDDFSIVLSNLTEEVDLEVGPRRC